MGGAFADRECNCQCFIFWDIGTSFLLSWGSVAELFEIHKLTESVVTDLDVKIRNTDVKLDHKFVLVPLVYNKETCNWVILKLEKDRAIGNTSVVGQSFSKFMEYNELVAKDVKKSYLRSWEQILDLNSMLSVKNPKSVDKKVRKGVSHGQIPLS